MDLYQSLVTVNPVTLIAQICNLFIQLFLAKKFFLDKVKAILDQRREAADKEITDAQAARAEAEEIKKTYEQNMVMFSSITRPSIWWNTGEWVASASSARYTRPGQITRMGGFWVVIMRACTGEVWVRRTMLSST